MAGRRVHMGRRGRFRMRIPRAQGGVQKSRGCEPHPGPDDDDGIAVVRNPGDGHSPPEEGRGRSSGNLRSYLELNARILPPWRNR